VVMHAAQPIVFTSAFSVSHSSFFIKDLTFLAIDSCISISDIFYNPRLGVFNIFCNRRTRLFGLHPCCASTIDLLGAP
jgi:hypothetical protein